MEFVLAQSSQEKLEKIFRDKFISLKQQYFNKYGCSEWWRDYLAGIKGVEYIYKFSNLADPLDYLIETINCGVPFDRFVIKDMESSVSLSSACQQAGGSGGPPSYSFNFIIIDRELAEKILVLGHLPN